MQCDRARGDAQQFALGSSNPDACADEGYKVVAAVMTHVWR